MEGTIGEIRMFAGNFAPRTWAFCEGQLLAISSNSALFSVIGTTYGGDGRTSFGLPDLRGRVPVGPGNGPGLSTYQWGERGGTEYNILNTTQLPPHNHIADMSSVQTNTTIAIPASDAGADGNNPEDSHLAEASEGNIYTSEASNVTLAPFNAIGTASGTVITQNTGGGQSINNIQPFLATYYIICLVGIYPSRS